MSDHPKPTPEQAEEAAQRFVDFYFGNNKPKPRISIPARMDNDDLLLMTFIRNSKLLLDALLAQEEAERAQAAYRKSFMTPGYLHGCTPSDDVLSEQAELKAKSDAAKAKANALHTAALAATKD